MVEITIMGITAMNIVGRVAMEVAVMGAGLVVLLQNEHFSNLGSAFLFSSHFYAFFFCRFRPLNSLDILQINIIQ